MLRQRAKAILWAIALYALVVPPLPVAAQSDLQAMHDATLEAFQSGDADLAMARAEAALTAARGMDAPNPGAYAFAFNNVAYLLTIAGQDPDRAHALWSEAMSFVSAHDARGSEAGLTVAMQLAALEAQLGQNTVAAERASQALRDARGTPFQAPVAGAAAGLFLDLGAYPQAVVAFSEMALLQPDLIRSSYGDLYVRLSTLIETVEADGQAADLAALIEAKIIIARHFLPEADRDVAIRNLRFQRYFALHTSGQFDQARQELRVWLTSGELTLDERDFVEAMAKTARSFARGAHIGTLDDLETARTATTVLRALETGQDADLGNALRAVALAEARFGQYERAVTLLTDAVAIFEQIDKAAELGPTLNELAWYLHLLGYSDQAAALFARADELPMPNARAEDIAETALNRATFHADLGENDRAAEWTKRAEAQLVQAPVSLRQSHLRLRLLTTAALIAPETGAPDIDPSALFKALDDQRQLGGGRDAEFALNLANSANALAMFGQFGEARDLLKEAVAINNVVLPVAAPQALDAFAMLQHMALLEGDQEVLIDNLRALTNARKAPAYRDRLPDVIWDFEIFAWALLADPTTRTPARIQEAYEALQWTQITRSAEALGVLETRMAIEDPGRGALLRERQDLMAAFDDMQNRIAAARGAGDAATGLANQLDQIEARLAQINASLDALGLNSSGVGQVTPLSLTDTQALLAADEALVTFLLPSLNPDVIPGVSGSSNHVLVVTQDTIHVAQVSEISRRGLNQRINELRCDVAISDPGCDNGGAFALRGAMSMDDADTPPGLFFDQQAAYALYDDLFGGVNDILAAHPNLIIVPPSDMLRLPFGALITSPEPVDGLADADWLIRRNTVSVVPSVSSLRTLRGRGQSDQPLQSMLGIGDPVIGDSGPMDCDTVQLAALRGMPPMGSALAKENLTDAVPLADIEYLSTLPRLPDSACELQAIQTAFRDKARLLTGKAATEKAIKTLDASGDLAAYDVLVFATHGLTAGESGANNPGLVMTPPATASMADDGLLTASEIATLDLNARLVVLSACNTAAGDARDSDGLSGLARAFFQSGAQSLFVTHWSVYSEAAVDMTTGVFAELSAHPQTAYANALQRATLSILDDPTRPAFHHHPSYWAAFSIIGAN